MELASDSPLSGSSMETASRIIFEGYCFKLTSSCSPAGEPRLRSAGLGAFPVDLLDPAGLGAFPVDLVDPLDPGGLLGNSETDDARVNRGSGLPGALRLTRALRPITACKPPRPPGQSSL